MTVFEVIVILAASPIIAALVYGAWKFSVDAEAEAPSERKNERPARKGKLGEAFNA